MSGCRRPALTIIKGFYCLFNILILERGLPWNSPVYLSYNQYLSDCKVFYCSYLNNCRDAFQWTCFVQTSLSNAYPKL